ncbi:hypothetical protein [Anaeromyxobacter oryzisoli]|uniref:hypothetical protein n=1 Tax=Anaeromyxobacter oryzisoli TaxID=2925408 RepID=UPI001F5736A2|nr:hypothetical protein [Anaeromyxobacter sp. SG63]
MLARLDEIPGVSRSQAECSGHYFLVELVDGATDGIGARALDILGRGARLVTAEEANAQHEARRRGEPWVTAADARALSFIEGRMLGVRVSAAVAPEVGLTAEERERLAEAVREEMFSHVERIYAGLASAGRFFEAWPQIAERIAERCAQWVEPNRARNLASALVGHFAPQRIGR